MIVVTGGAGFIGSNIIKRLNELGCDNIIAVDDLSDGKKFYNIADCTLADYIDKDDFLSFIHGPNAREIDVIFHEGACSTTTEWDGRYMMENNYQYSKKLLHCCAEHRIQFIYASSAAVYGGGSVFEEIPQAEKPLNVYGYSKLLFDQYVRRHFASLSNQVVGLRYFNVYGPREQHKGSMASVAFHLNQQLNAGNDTIKLFGAYDGYEPGTQSRDFIYVDDVVDVNLWFMANPDISGIVNCGTGRAQPFNDVANAVIDYHQKGTIEYIDFPDHLKGAYQSYTEANIDSLRDMGYQQEFKTVEQGVRAYMEWLNG